MEPHIPHGPVEAGSLFIFNFRNQLTLRFIGIRKVKNS